VISFEIGWGANKKGKDSIRKEVFPFSNYHGRVIIGK
jgi:hypothetical protein